MSNHSRSEPGVVYVLNHYDPDSSDHLAYNARFVRELAARVPVHVVVERPSPTARHGTAGPPVTFQKRTWLPARFLELLRIFSALRLQGWRHFYVHYSVIGGVAAGIVTLFMGGCAYYWSCGLVREFHNHKASVMERAWAWLTNVIALELVFGLRVHLVTGTAGMVRYYRQRYAFLGRTHVVPNWVSPPDPGGLHRLDLRRSVGLPLSATVALFVHRLSRRKGADRLCSIVPRLAELTGQHICWIVIGAGPEEGSLREFARTCHGAEVRVLGAQPNKLVWAYMRCADALAMPSREEGVPRVLLEAMAAGVPFVASDVGAVRDITSPDHQKSVVVPKEDDEAFATALADILLNRGRAELLRRAGYEVVSRHSISAALHSFVEMLNPSGGVPRDT